MKTEYVSILRSPSTHDPFRLIEEDSGGKVNQKLVTARTRENYPVIQGIPVFLKEFTPAQVSKNNKFYNVIAPLYDLLHAVPAYKKGGERKIREKFLQKLKIKENDKVLEVAVGTGANLRQLPRNAQYFGVDISPGMLKRCAQMSSQLGIEAELFLADAENLPFRNNVFDTVMSVCGLRLLNDKARAINEMVRVAKPGATVLIVDQIKSGCPMELIDPGMRGINREDIPEWEVYCLTFIKPLKLMFS